MKKKLSLSFICLFFCFILGGTLICSTLCSNPVYAKSSSGVRYNSRDKRYDLYNSSGKKVTKEGIYSIKNQKANSKTFDGIYYVSSTGRIYTTPGVRHIAKKILNKTTYYGGCYYFGRGGKLTGKAGVAYLQNQKSKGQLFNGYYYYNTYGRINYTENGLIALNCTASNGKTFKGYYYRDKMSRLAGAGSIRNIKLKSGANKSYPGYHYFTTGGRLDTTATSHKLNTSYKGVAYKGYYCFAGNEGRMIRTKGLVTGDNDVYYYVTDSYGKCFTGGKKTVAGFSYSFKSNGKGLRTSTKLSSLKSKLSSQLRSYGGTWSVYVKRLDNNDSITINDTPLYAASVIKPYVMASIYNQIDSGVISETSTITSLNRSMITVSSNDAFNELVKRQTKSYNFSTGRSVVNSYLKNKGYTKTSVHHTLHPASGPLISDGGSNRTSVKDCGKLLESIYRGTCVNKESSKKMLNFLLAQQRRWKIPAGVPSGTKVANKTGETSSSDHDIAIVYSPKCTYILCVMSTNAASSSSRISQISRTVYYYFN